MYPPSMAAVYASQGTKIPCPFPCSSVYAPPVKSDGHLRSSVLCPWAWRRALAVLFQAKYFSATYQFAEKWARRAFGNMPYHLCVPSAHARQQFLHCISLCTGDAHNSLTFPHSSQGYRCIPGTRAMHGRSKEVCGQWVAWTGNIGYRVAHKARGSRTASRQSVEGDDQWDRKTANQESSA